ncbi:hypothetical protein CROQUDRAFT_102016 [Cronartium quercuum f. sp. fusiforme G11]|uniref:Uncharacterized protein n=1 Tax=Cronartium quercuum f. sp. fusiforme G11 TaxID=708437 RepID=A0A9P6T5D5_9BASI|nr:hypothetical protein CROQUDRAFT_102016 [Cronartium quercuum f. sp. fusiforme G11]
MSNKAATLIIGSLSQRQAAAINNFLSKITVKKPLDGSSWNSWSNSIMLSLAGVMYDQYLLSDKLPDGEDEALNNVIQKCLVTWLISNMNQTESDRALTYITSYNESGEKHIAYKPTLLW